MTGQVEGAADPPAGAGLDPANDVDMAGAKTNVNNPTAAGAGAPPAGGGGNNPTEPGTGTPPAGGEGEEGGSGRKARFEDGQGFTQQRPRREPKRPYLIGGKINAQAGDRPYKLWQEHATILCTKVGKRKEVIFKICTLEGKPPSKLPNELKVRLG